MKKLKIELKIGASFAIFVLFFGIALVEAIKNNNWIESVLFVILGIIFLRVWD